MSKSDTNSVSLEEQLSIMGKQLDQLERENDRLVVQLKEVIKMNTHWQRYDSQREEYVLKLTRTNKELQDRVSDFQRQLTEHSKTLQGEIKKEHPRLSDGLTSLQLDDQTEAEDASQNDLNVSNHSPSSSLRKAEEIAALTDHIAKLKDRISELERGRAARRKSDDEEVALLREQVNVCVEDFKQERKDRERCHGENERLKERLAQAENDLRANEERLYVYQEQIKRLQERRQYRQEPVPSARRMYDEPCCYPEERPRPCFCHQNGATRRARGRGAYHLGNDMTDGGDVEVDGSPEEPQDETDGVPNEPHDETDGNNNNPKNNALQCPNCLKSFGVHRHSELLDHIETCLGHEQ